MPRLQSDPAFGWAAYQHTPCYRLLLAYTDGRPRDWLLATASPQLRPYITFVKAERTYAARDQASREIRAALAASGVRALFMSSGNDDSFQIIVRTQEDAERVRRAIPERYRSQTVVRLGYVEPQPE